MEIVPVAAGENIENVRNLLREYWASFGFSPCFQGFSEELDALPGAYAAPHGRLALAIADSRPAGCIALRPLDRERCEAKRLFVRPEYRGRGIGRALLEWVIAEARALGYREMYGHTMEIMDRALAMYRHHGLERTDPYLPDLPPDAICLRLRL
jgi:GNAT superfamily N-acetyltransferase